MTETLVFAIPSKGRLMDRTLAVLEQAELYLQRFGSSRGYRGEIKGLENLEVAFMSAGEIASALRSGRAHLGVTGEDLMREEVSAPEACVEFVTKLGFGHADVVVAVPKCWLDVRRMRDLGEAAIQFRRLHGRRIRVATKYMNLTRGYFTRHAISDYRLVESLGATEGTPAAGTAEAIVDITSTGATLTANGLKILADGVILKSQANLIASRTARWDPETRAAQNQLFARLQL
ncbi:MAG: ATP phosphoribosyltransferase [Pseudomonadota bacterium]